MRHTTSDTDTIGDVLHRYPAPTGDEVAYARHSHDPALNRYGYDGAWHDQPPAEAVAADEREAREAEARRAAAEDAARPHVRGVLRDRDMVVIAVPGRREPAYLRLDELRAAAAQDDPEGREVYGRLLAEAEHLREIARRGI